MSLRGELREMRVLAARVGVPKGRALQDASPSSAAPVCLSFGVPKMV